MPTDDLARAVVGLPGFAITSGMLFTDGVAVAYRVHHDGHGLTMVPNIPGVRPSLPRSSEAWIAHCLDAGMAPVLADDATGGCLLAMLGEHLACDVDVHTGIGHRHPGRVFRLRIAGRWERDVCPSLGHACAAALVALGRCG